jgi:hypothetical protein
VLEGRCMRCKQSRESTKNQLLCINCSRAQCRRASEKKSRRPADGRCLGCIQVKTLIRRGFCAECCESLQAKAQGYRGKKADPTTPEQRAAIIESQEGRCAICGTTPETGLFLDHCHHTGRVRGYLCRCNTGIGLLKDNPVIVRAAAQYLESYETDTATYGRMDRVA